VRLDVVHRTRYRYAGAVRDSFNELRVRPLSNAHQDCERFLLRVLPPVRLRHYLDLHANHVNFFELHEPHDSLEIECRSRVTMRSPPPLSEEAFPMARVAECARMERCHEYLQPSRYVDPSPDAWRLAIDASHEQPDVWGAAVAIRRLVFREFAYEPGTTTAHTPVADVLRDRRGVCQDFAHVMLAMCRALGIPALYVSGYLYNGPRELLRGAQASHAWCEVFLPGTGWRGLDPTNDQPVDERYVKVAVGRDYADVAPVQGSYRGTADQELTVEVDVQRVVG
jgi:transglutaminase-like putative cysteine protease